MRRVKFLAGALLARVGSSDGHNLIKSPVRLFAGYNKAPVKCYGSSGKFTWLRLCKWRLPGNLLFGFVINEGRLFCSSKKSNLSLDHRRDFRRALLSGFSQAPEVAHDYANSGFTASEVQAEIIRRSDGSGLTNTCMEELLF